MLFICYNTIGDSMSEINKVAILKVIIMTNKTPHRVCRNKEVNSFIIEPVYLVGKKGVKSYHELKKCPICSRFLMTQEEYRSVKSNIIQIKGTILKEERNIIKPKSETDNKPKIKLNIVYKNECLIKGHNVVYNPIDLKVEVKSNVYVTKRLNTDYCNDCNMYVIDMNEYEKSIANGEPVCNLYVNGVYTPRRNRIIISKPLKENALSYNNQRNTNADFFVRTNVMDCNKKNHTIEEVEAIVPVADIVGVVSNEKIHGYYCKNCNLYFIYNIDYEKLKRKGIPLCKIFEYSKYIANKNNNINFNPESIIHACGYNVGSGDNLTELQRQKVLSFIVDKGIMSKFEIIDLLEYFIFLRKGNSSMINAISKWEKDIEYLKKYKRDTSSVNVRSIIINRYNERM